MTRLKKTEEQTDLKNLHTLELEDNRQLSSRTRDLRENSIRNELRSDWTHRKEEGTCRR
jgi:hypothetical protein